MSKPPIQDKAGNAGEKLHKVLARQGLGSRRELESWIAAGRIIVNGEPAHVGQRVQDTDVVEVDGRRVRHAGNLTPQVIIMNKAAGVVCSRHDPEGRPTVFDELPRLSQGRWIGVGRLDLQTTGLLLLTNDGALANKLMHPSTGLDREYAVRINTKLDAQAIDQLTQGVEVEGEMLRFSDVRFYDGSDNNFWYHVVVMEGKNREVRRLFEAVDCVVSRLKRVRYGPVILPSWLRNKQWATLRQEDLKALYKLLGLKLDASAKSPKGAHRTPRAKLAKTTCLLPYPKLG